MPVAIAELEAGAGDEVANRARDQHFARLRDFDDPRRDVHRDAADAAGDGGALAGMDAGPTIG